MKYYPASTRTVFEEQSILDLPVGDRDFRFHSRTLMDGPFQRAFASAMPFTTTEPFDMHVARAQS